MNKLIDALIYYYVNHEYYLTKLISWKMLDDETIEITFEGSFNRRTSISTIKLPLKRFYEED